MWRAFGDSFLMVQQVSKVCQCYDGSLNTYLDKRLDIICCFDEFVIYYIPREKNGRANTLAQQASGYKIVKKNIFMLGNRGMQTPMRRFCTK
jgi:hypothetical protein